MASVTVGLAFKKVSGCFKVWIYVFICRFWSVVFLSWFEGGLEEDGAAAVLLWCVLLDLLVQVSG
jgi:hypothetical protein